MALEMQVYKEITSYVAKPMWGLTWRQIGAIAYMVIIGGGVFAGVSAAIVSASGDWSNGQAWSHATSAAMYVMFPVIVPAAIWGWARPMGLKPEVFAQYLIRDLITKRVTTYADTYSAPGEHNDPEPVPGRGAAVTAEQHRGARPSGRDVRVLHARLEKALSEHQEEVANRSEARRQARSNRQGRH